MAFRNYMNDPGWRKMIESRRASETATAKGEREVINVKSGPPIISLANGHPGERAMQAIHHGDASAPGQARMVQTKSSQMTPADRGSLAARRDNAAAKSGSGGKGGGQMGHPFYGNQHVSG